MGSIKLPRPLHTASYSPLSFLLNFNFDPQHCKMILRYVAVCHKRSGQCLAVSEASKASESGTKLLARAPPRGDRRQSAAARQDYRLVAAFCCRPRSPTFLRPSLSFNGLCAPCSLPATPYFTSPGDCSLASRDSLFYPALPVNNPLYPINGIPWIAICCHRPLSLPCRFSPVSLLKTAQSLVLPRPPRPPTTPAMPASVSYQTATVPARILPAALTRYVVIPFFARSETYTGINHRTPS